MRGCLLRSVASTWTGFLYVCVAKPGAEKNCKQTPVKYEIPSANPSFLKAYDLESKPSPASYGHSEH